jgi:hypothetical protein
MAGRGEMVSLPFCLLLFYGKNSRDLFVINLLFYGKKMRDLPFYPLTYSFSFFFFLCEGIFILS